MMINVNMGSVELCRLQDGMQVVLLDLIRAMQLSGATGGKVSCTMDVKLNYVRDDERGNIQIIPIIKYKIGAKQEHEKLQGIEGMIDGQISISELIKENDG